MNYLPLSTIITADHLPEFLSFLDKPIDLIFDNLFFHSFSANHDLSGTKVSYFISIVSPEKLALTIPGADLSFVLNPSDDETISEIPISLTFISEIAPLLTNFKLSNFPFTPEAFGNLIRSISNLQNEELYSLFLLVNSKDQGEVQLRYSFVTQLNNYADNNNISRLNLSQTPAEDNIHIIDNEIISYVNSEQIPMWVLVFDSYIETNDLELKAKKIGSFLSWMFLGFDIGDNYKSIYELLTKILIPTIEAAVQIKAGIEFPRNVLAPMVQIDGKWEKAPEEAHFRLIAPEVGEFYFNNQSLGFNSDALDFIEITANPYLRAEILKTGFTIDFGHNAGDRILLDFSKEKNDSRIASQTYPKDFVGVYFDYISINFPDFIKKSDGTLASITGRNLFIGTGGISGRIGLESGEALDLRLGKADGFSIQLKQFFLEFRQNSVTGGGAEGTLRIPFGEQPKDIDIDLTFRENGNFSIVGKNINVELKIKDILTFKVREVGLGQAGNRFFLSVGGELTLKELEFFEGDIKFDIRKLIIWEDGSLEFESGGITLPTSIKIQLGPVAFSVTKLHFGTYTGTHADQERKYYYIGFDGGLNVGNAGVDIQGKGIRYYFSYDDHPFHHFFRMDGIGIDLSIPKNNPKLILKGFLAIQKNGYAGSVQFSLPSIGLKGGAVMALNPDLPAFLVDAFLDLPAPIPLGPTGLGIYGFRGLFGDNYAIDRQEPETWWEFFKRSPTGIRPPRGLEDIGTEGQVGKFKPKKGGMVIGAGVTIGSMGDRGWVFSSKILLLLGLPDTLLLVGQASILADPANFDSQEDPPFGVLLAISPDSIEAGLSVRYLLPSESGDVMTLNGAMELAYFFRNSSAWYLNIGRDYPEDKRISARLLSLFDVYAFLMLSARGISGGAGFEWKEKRNFGPVGIELGVFMHTRGFISFKPIQLGGSIDVGGMVRVRLAFFKIGIGARAYLSAEAPCPTLIRGNLQISIGTPWPLDDININFSLNWNLKDCSHSSPIKIIEKPDNQPVPGAIHIPSGKTLAIKFFGYHQNEQKNGFNFSDVPFIPLDCFIDLEFSQCVLPQGVSNIGGHLDRVDNKVTVPPDGNVSRRVEHFPEVRQIKIYYQMDNEWLEYRVYEQMEQLMEQIRKLSKLSPDAPGFSEDSENVNIKDVKDGYWQLTEPHRINKVRLLSQNVFSYTTNAVSGSLTLESLGFQETSLLCRKEIEVHTCVNWQEEPTGTAYPLNQLFDDQGLTFKINGAEAKVEDRELYLANLERWEIYFDDPVSVLEELRIITDAMVKVSFYELSTRKNPRTNMPESNYDLIHEEYYNREGNRSANIRIHYQSDSVLLSYLVVTTYAVGASYIPNTADLYLGKSIFNLISGFSGGLDDLKVFGKALTTSEVRQAMETTRYLNGRIAEQSGANPDGLMGWWGYSDPQGQDQSNKGHHAISEGQQRSTNRPLNLLGRNKPVWSWGSPNVSSGFKVNHTPDLSFDDSDYTLMGWIKPAVATGLITQYPLFSKEHNASSSGYYFGIECGLQATIQGQQYYAFRLVWQNKRSGILSRRALTYAKVRYELSPPVQGAVYDIIEVRTGKIYKKGFKWQIDTGNSGVIISEDPWFHVAVSVNRRSGILTFWVNGEELERWNENELRVQGASTVTPLAQSVRVQNLCFTTRKMEEIRKTIPADQQVKQEVQAMSTAMTRYLQPIWRPNTKYLIEVLGADKFNNQEDLQYYYFGFQTPGPLGHYPQEGLLKQLPELENLMTYIDFDKSYPNADGYLAHAKPLYYAAPDLRLFFNRPYMYTMFGNWTGEDKNNRLKVKVYGAGTDKTDASFDPDEGFWELNDLNQESDDVAFLNRINEYIKENKICDGDPNCHCTPLNGGLNKLSVNARYKFKDLQPNKLYTAVFYAQYREKSSEVWRYVFRTSRYADLRQQIGSFQLDPNQQALFKHSVDLDQQQMELAQRFFFAVADPNYQSTNQNLEDRITALSDEFAHPFDRLVNGILAVPALLPPVCTEVNVFIHNNRPFGIWVRNPEPFFDPRISPEELLVKGALSIPDRDPNRIRVLFSKDRSQVWISQQRESGMVYLDDTNPDWELQFRALSFNGKEFEIMTEYNDQPAVLSFLITP